ncbi:MAG TPA: sigma-70 family RNA polymerase sigma factor [Pyrinomonadaceae bacterium]|nr:sigma-70 family RNA polymerase sigma factor [Pyrinomonadaceae bacterium]
MKWLGSTPDRAAEKYEEIRRRLIAFFLNRQCAEAEDLADETINRVAGRLAEIIVTYDGEPMRYFYGVANNIALEYSRRKRPPIVTPPPTPESDQMEPYHECLDKCLEHLPPKNREIILNYYRDKREVEDAPHRELGAQMKLKSGALRVRAYRIRLKLEKCINECLRQKAERNDIDTKRI